MAMARRPWVSSQRALVEPPESLRPLGWTAVAFFLRRPPVLNAQRPCQAVLHQWQPCFCSSLLALHRCRFLSVSKTFTSHGVCCAASFLFMFLSAVRLYDIQNS